jgi:tRNA pseudouridine synthase 10
MPSILDKARKILERPVCDNCLGRQFGQLVSGLSNEERGRVARIVAAMSLDKEKLSDEDKKIDLSNFAGYGFHVLEQKPPSERKECWVCGGLFSKLDEIAKKAAARAKGLEFNTFLVGTKIPSALLDKEEELWEDAGIEWAESIKAELNREIGKRLEAALGKPFDRKNPDIVFLVDLATNTVKVSLNPLFIYGEYQKLVRGIPQTKWPSKKYRTSVEELIAKPFMAVTKGKGHKLHGLGREDIDARCLAWRPFVLEILEPQKRSTEFAKLAKKIDRRVKVRSLRPSSIAEVRSIKESKLDKSYACIVKCEKPLVKADLKKLKQLVGEIKQKTPKRVLHRRADRFRKRKLKKLEAKYINSKSFKLVVTTEAGLYVKELISGDDGRTRPSVSELLGNACVCKDLDVVKIHTTKS